MPKIDGEALLPGGDLTPADEPNCQKAPEEVQGSRFWVGPLLLLVSGISLTLAWLKAHTQEGRK